MFRASEIFPFTLLDPTDVPDIPIPCRIEVISAFVGPDPTRGDPNGVFRSSLLPPDAHTALQERVYRHLHNSTLGQTRVADGYSLAAPQVIAFWAYQVLQANIRDIPCGAWSTGDCRIDAVRVSPFVIDPSGEAGWIEYVPPYPAGPKVGW